MQQRHWHKKYACPIFYCMKVWDCLPREVSDKLRNLSDLREIRIRDGRCAWVNIGDKWYAVGKNGLERRGIGGMILGEVCNDIVRAACNNSVYAYEKMLAKGFFSLEDGVRVGVCGSVAGSTEAVFRKYTSLCFRIPHRVNLVDSDAMEQCLRGNVVVIGPPGSGKTTFLRDLSAKLSRQFNVLVLDERGELFYDDDKANIGNCDVIKWCGKDYGFVVGIRSMSPHWIVCDELTSDDSRDVCMAIDSGVNVACSVHGKDIADFADKFDLLQYFSTAAILNKTDMKPKIVPLNSPNNAEKREYT